MSANNAKTALAYCRLWHKVDARDQVLGRLATRIALVLQGKHKPIYHPAADCGDYVVVTNAQDIRVTGNKEKEKVYRYHTGYPGGLRTIPYKALKEKSPEKILIKAVSGMLPKNRLRQPRLERLKVFVGETTPYENNFAKSYT